MAIPTSWDVEGVYRGYRLHYLNLVNVPNKIKVDGWINIYSLSADFPLQGIFLDKDKAVQHGVSAIARKHISFEIEEGQFDE